MLEVNSSVNSNTVFNQEQMHVTNLVLMASKTRALSTELWVTLQFFRFKYEKHYFVSGEMDTLAEKEIL